MHFHKEIILYIAKYLKYQVVNSEAIILILGFMKTPHFIPLVNP